MSAQMAGRRTSDDVGPTYPPAEGPEFARATSGSGPPQSELLAFLDRNGAGSSRSDEEIAESGGLASIVPDWDRRF